jgi:hypothetical protein
MKLNRHTVLTPRSAHQRFGLPAPTIGEFVAAIVAAVATPITTTATAVTTTTTIATAKVAAAALFTWFGFIDFEGATINVFAV